MYVVLVRQMWDTYSFFPQGTLSHSLFSRLIGLDCQIQALGDEVVNPRGQYGVQISSLTNTRNYVTIENKLSVRG